MSERGYRGETQTLSRAAQESQARSRMREMAWIRAPGARRVARAHLADILRIEREKSLEKLRSESGDKAISDGQDGIMDAWMLAVTRRSEEADQAGETDWHWTSLLDDIVAHVVDLRRVPAHWLTGSLARSFFDQSRVHVKMPRLGLAFRLLSVRSVERRWLASFQATDFSSGAGPMPLNAGTGERHML